MVCLFVCKGKTYSTNSGTSQYLCTESNVAFKCQPRCGWLQQTPRTVHCHIWMLITAYETGSTITNILLTAVWLQHTSSWCTHSTKLNSYDMIWTIKELRHRSKICHWSQLPVSMRADGWLGGVTESSDMSRHDTQYAGSSPAVIYDLNICH